MDRTATNYSVFDEVNLMSQKIGNNSFVSNVQNANYLNSLIDDTPAYQSYMSQNASNMYSTNPANNELFRGASVGLVMGGLA
jgi:hypothetical protein